MNIQNNTVAMNVVRQMGLTQGNLSKNTKRLSSGYRINCAADDAAGLSISEKMRKQIRCLTQGIENAENGISLCQVADGALSEVHDILQRMNELAVQAANGTLSAEDRQSVDAEIQMLKDEIDRTHYTTTFNEHHIFQNNDSVRNISGSSGNPLTQGKFFQLLGNNVSNSGYMNEPLALHTISDSNCTFDLNTNSYHPSNPYVSVHIDFGAIESHMKDLVGSQFYVNCCTDDCPKIVSFTDDIGITTKTDAGGGYLSEIKIGMKKNDGTYFTQAEEFNKYVIDALRPIIDPNTLTSAGVYQEHVQFGYNGKTMYIMDIDNASWDPSDKQAAYFCDPENIGGKEQTSIHHSQNSIWIQSGANIGDGLFINIGAISTVSLGIMDVSAATEESSLEALDRISNAISIVSSRRSLVGASQNRLEHTIQNQQNVVENTTSAESRIRDTDMAKEMVHFSSNHIIFNAGQSMLAQANQMNQGVLSLLA